MDEMLKSIESLIDLSVHPLSNLANLSAYIRPGSLRVCGRCR